MCLVFHESMYSALPTKLMLRGTVSIRNIESRNEMWFGHRIAGPDSGSRSKPVTSMCHSLRVTGAEHATGALLRLAGARCVSGGCDHGRIVGPFCYRRSTRQVIGA